VVVDQQTTQHKRKLIAVVEDDANIAEMFQTMVDNDGRWRLHVFSDGQVAITQLPGLGADLILLDIGLPSLDGASLYKMLRGHNSTKHTPIIVVTASQDWELHRMGLQAGLFLRKPFKMQELLFMIQALLPEN